MPRAAIIAVALALASLPAFASGAITEATQLNLDTDPDLEEIVPLTVSDPDGGPQKSIVLYDSCGGTQQAFRLGTPQDNVDVVVQEVDGTTASPEIRLIGSSGAAGRVGIVLLARLGSARATRGCPSVVSLFRYSSVDPKPRPPKGYAVAGFGVRYKDLTSRYRGKEIELVEGLARRGGALCCPSRKRVTHLRYDTKRDRYVRYAVRLVTTRNSPRS